MIRYSARCMISTEASVGMVDERRCRGRCGIALKHSQLKEALKQAFTWPQGWPNFIPVEVSDKTPVNGAFLKIPPLGH